MKEAPILVVDDDQDVRETLSLVLELHGYDVIAGVDGLDALDKVKSGPRPGAILVDLMMPRMNGEDFVKALRRDARLSAIPVVVLSGDAAACRAATTLSAQACLIKPVDVSALLDAVRHVLDLPTA
jgi:two-component system, chemotaxis family, chemotaxis protein CheY